MPGRKMLALEEGMKSFAGRVPSKRPVRGPRILSFSHDEHEPIELI